VPYIYIHLYVIMESGHALLIKNIIIFLVTRLFLHLRLPSAAFGIKIRSAGFLNSLSLLMYNELILLNSGNSVYGSLLL